MNEQDERKNFYNSLLSGLSNLDEVPTQEIVTEKAKQLSSIFSYEGDLESIIEEALSEIVTRMGSGASIVDIEAQHDNEWVSKREDIVWTYSGAYEEYLRSESWNPLVIRSLSDVGNKILGHLQDPKSEGSWDRRGLVIGQVQSGKTANYMGVIAKAADAGYKFIIVIAGIHNNLRKQTQERVDEGFVGRSSDPKNRVPVGVGANKNYPKPVTITNIYDDFKTSTAKQSGWKLNDFSRPIILVIKKNVKTLESLHNWLRDMNLQGDNQISDVPMLMIDDEADNASINTNTDDLDPTKTNKMIRQILQLFAKSCYVGYTATPFANIFINPDSYDDEVREELFPRDFIYSLDAPTNYFGPRRVFLEDSSQTFVKSITDAEEYIGFSHKIDDGLTELPPSLYKAIDIFIIARTIRNLRGQHDKHCTMMINISRFVVMQKLTQTFVSEYEKKVREAVKANYAMPEDVSSQNTYMQKLKSAYDTEYSDCGFLWSEVKNELFDSFKTLKVLVVNSKSDETLDYKKFEDEGTGLTAIAIGGLSLSRGLTLEGLVVSYMYRNTRMYDTLMQMGRWFGFRFGYEDLCRVFLSEDSINWYAHIAEASQELKDQIYQMRRDKLSPRDFGLYVQAHPDRLLITAVNKMRTGEKFTIHENLSGRLRESYILPNDENINQHNESLISEYWKNGFEKGIESVEKTKKGWIIEDVDISFIREFLVRFVTDRAFAELKNSAIAYLDILKDDHPEGDVLLISLSDQSDPDSFRLGPQYRESAELKTGGYWRMSKDRVASRGDEQLGLTDPQLEFASKCAKEEGEHKEPSDYHYRLARNKPLLMIHLLNLGKGEDMQERVPAFGISYPCGHYNKSVDIVANKVWIEKWIETMHGATQDGPEDEEDYD